MRRGKALATGGSGSQGRQSGTGAALRRLAADQPLLLRLTRADLYVDYRPVLRDLDWELRKGEHWAVFGANGAGKTSFLKLLYGDLRRLWVGASSAAGFPQERRSPRGNGRWATYRPSCRPTIAVDVTVLDLVASGRYASIGLADAPTAADRRIALRWLKFFRLLSVAGRRPRELSYGQLRRALIARALAGGRASCCSTSR